MQDTLFKEKVPPVAWSPLDQYRGSGRHTEVPRKIIQSKTLLKISENIDTINLIVGITTLATKIEDIMNM